MGGRFAREVNETAPGCIGVFAHITWTGLVALYQWSPSTIGTEHNLFLSKFCVLLVPGALCYISYFRAWLTDPGGVPDSFYMEGGDTGSRGPTPTAADKARICNKCDAYKPPRTHHCSKCDRCVLKMDHHCPWTSNCVGYYNYKYFFLLLIWGSIAMITFIVLALPAGWASLWSDSEEKEWTLIMTILANFVVLGYLLSLLITHVLFIGVNKTTIEWKGNLRAGILWSEYNMGLYNNLREVLGSNPLTWLIPIEANTLGDGTQFKKPL